MQYAKHYCHGKSLCFPTANSAILGDPCPGTSKYFKMEYECKDASAFTTSAPKTTAAAKVHSPPAPVPPGTCGKTYHSQSRIVGGKDAVAGAWPWQAAIYLNGLFHCGASLINSRWIVTANHCLEKNPQPGSYEVVLGDHDRSRNEGSEVRSLVDKIVLHPDYNVGHTYNNDIAMMKLARPMVLNTRVAPVCLPQQNVNVAIGKMCYLSGWGMITYPSNPHDILQQGKLPIVSRRECSRRLKLSALGNDLSVSAQMLCAGYYDSSNSTDKDLSACRGDSGGPFVCQNNQGDWVLQGIVSWGSIRCVGRDRYSVFARVSEYRDWIDDVVANNGLLTTAAPGTQTPQQPPMPGGGAPPMPPMQ